MEESYKLLGALLIIVMATGGGSYWMMTNSYDLCVVDGVYGTWEPVDGFFNYQCSVDNVTQRCWDIRDWGANSNSRCMKYIHVGNFTNFNEGHAVGVLDDSLKITFMPETIECNVKGRCDFEFTVEDYLQEDACYNVSSVYFTVVNTTDINDIGTNLEITYTNIADYDSYIYVENDTGLNLTGYTPTEAYQEYLDTGIICNDNHTKTIEGYFNIDEKSGKFDSYFPFLGKLYYIDPYWNISTTGFNNGTYNRTQLYDDNRVKSSVATLDDVGTTTSWLNSSDLIIHYKLNEASGTLENYVAGSPNNATCTNCVYSKQGINDDAIGLVGSSSARISQSYGSTLPGAGQTPFTLLMWAKPTDGLTSYLAGWGQSGFEFSPFINSVGQIGITNEDGIAYYYGLNTVSYDTWHLFSFSYNGTTMCLGYDVEDQTRCVDDVFDPDGSTFYIGRRGITATYATMDVDEVYLFNRSLSLPEIIEYYNYSKHGYYESEIFDGSTLSSWDNITFNITAGGHLPANGTIETGYLDYGVDMSGTSVLVYFEEDNVTNLVDSSGNSNSFTEVGSSVAYQDQGVIHYGLGYSETGYIQTTPSYNFTTGFTTGGWYNYNKTGTRFSFSTLGTAASGWEFRLHPSAYIEYFLNGASYNTNGVYVMPPYKYHHIMMTADIDNNQTRVYVNGVNVYNNSYTGGTIADGKIWYIGSRYGAYTWSGNIDEAFLKGGPIDDAEAIDIYKHQRAKVESIEVKSCNDALCSGETYTPLNVTPDTQSMSLDDNQYFQYKVTYDSDFFDFPAEMADVSVEYSEAIPEYTAINHFDVVIPDIIFDSATYTTIFNTTFNLTTADTLYPHGSLNIKKQTLPQASDVYMKFSLNGDDLFDSKLRTVQSTSDIGAVTIPLSNKTGSIGENTGVIQVRDTGNGAISLSNFEVHTLTDKSERGGSIQINTQTTSFSFANQPTYVNVANFTVPVTGNGSIYVDVGHKFNGTGATTPTCYVTDGVTTSAEYSSAITGTGQTKSSGTQSWANTSYSSDVDFMVYCKNDNTETVGNTVSVLSFVAADGDGSKIKGFNNFNSSVTPATPQTLTAGTYNLLQEDNYLVQAGDEVEISFTLVAQSTSGSQTAYIYVNATNGITTLSKNLSRYYANNADIGTSKLVTSIDVDTLDTYNISAWLVVPAGETLNVLSESMAGFEVTNLNLTQGNVPPIVDIITPTDNSIVFSAAGTIAYTAIDPNDNLDECGLTLTNSTGTTFIVGTNTTSPVSIDWTVYAQGDYNLTLTCNDTLGLSASNTHNVSVTFGDISSAYIITNLTENVQSEFFLIEYNFTCNGYDCYTVKRNLTSDLNECTIRSDQESLKSYGTINSSTTVEGNVSYQCTIANANPTFTLSVYSSTLVAQTDTESISIISVMDDLDENLNYSKIADCVWNEDGSGCWNYKEIDNIR